MTYTPSGNPATGSEGLSALMRAEFASIAAAFGAQPRITTAGNFDTILVQVGSFSFTLPATAGTLALVADITTAVAAEAAIRAAADLLLAPKASPPLTGTPTAPTAAPGTNTTQLATTAFSAAAVAVETAARVAGDALFKSATWHSVTGSRVMGTTYTNALTYPISVMVTTGNNVGVVNTVTITVGGVAIASYVSTTSAATYCFNFQVPAGQTYNVTSGFAVITWFEFF